MKERTKKEVIALYEKHSGRTIRNESDLCVIPRENFPGIYCIGWFASDRGCMGDEVLFGNDFVEAEDITSKALNYYGWDTLSKRETLALNWTMDVLLVFESPKRSMDKRFEKAGVTYEAPKVKTTADGHVVVRLWVQEPVGMLPKADFYKIEVTYDQKGAIVNRQKLSSFTC